MIDLHSHMLPEVDDGARSLEQSVEMCRMAAADGTTHIVATPHSNARYIFLPEENEAKIAELQAAAGDTPRILAGCDFHLSYENIQEALRNHAPFTINHKNHLLVEFDSQFISPGMRQVFFELLSAGIIPVITHPERNQVIQQNLQLLCDWVTAGCLTQITAQSLTGRFGSRAQRLSRRLLEHNLVHVIASDAHDLESRPPRLSECFDLIKKEYGETLADELFRKHPQAILEGNDVVPGRSPTDFQKPRKRTWFSRILFPNRY